MRIRDNEAKWAFEALRNEGLITQVKIKDNAVAEQKPENSAQIKYEIDKEYKGDISSYVPSIVNAGLIATVVFYQISPSGEDANNKSHIRKNKVNDAILFILRKMYADKNTYYNLYDFVSLNTLTKGAKTLLLSRIELAIIALKLAIRFYPDKI